MRRLVALTAAIALATSTSSALAAARDGIKIVSFGGSWSVSYFATNGPDALPITQREYEDLVRATACGPRSAATVWVRERRVVLTCDGG
ncbi:MAG: hypothetical protein JWO85_2572 [Candidatus Eremiobacteraeota bacterium]|nr:hypothetical protein [Candidatus Eremiobacteraeota bacterium]